MFPSLATPENMTRNNVSATMFPSLARALQRLSGNDKKKMKTVVYGRREKHRNETLLWKIAELNLQPANRG